MAKIVKIEKTIVKTVSFKKMVRRIIKFEEVV